MLGLMYLAGIMVYLIAVGLVAWLISWIAKKNGGTRELWWLITVVFMLGLVLWDWPLMEIKFRHDCSTHAEFTVNKTLDQWKAENPGIAETLHPTDGVALQLKKVQHNNVFAESNALTGKLRKRHSGFISVNKTNGLWTKKQARYWHSILTLTPIFPR